MSLTAITAINLLVTNPGSYAPPTGALFIGHVNFISTSIGGQPNSLIINGVTVGAVSVGVSAPQTLNPGDVFTTSTGGVVSLTGLEFPV